MAFKMRHEQSWASKFFFWFRSVYLIPENRRFLSSGCSEKCYFAKHRKRIELFFSRKKRARMGYVRIIDRPRNRWKG